MVQRKQKPPTPVTKHASLARQVMQYAAQHGMFAQTQSVLVGVSGGADSMVLVHILQQAGLKIVAAHVNYGLRGTESNGDESLVKRWCKKNNIPLFVLKPDLKKFASKHKTGTQEAARIIRYQWFETLRQQQNLDAIAVAHHATDQAETVLFNITRGAGIKGMRGMMPVNGFVKRPLLASSRADILAWAKLHKIPFRTDSSNLTDTYTRNLLRNRVLPLLEQINNTAVQHISSSASVAAMAWAWMENEAAKWKQQYVTIQNGQTAIPIEAIEQHVAAPALLHVLLHPLGFTPDVIAQVYTHLHGEPGKLFESETHRLLRDRKYLLLADREKNIGEALYQVRANQRTVHTGAFVLKLKKQKKAAGLITGADTALLDASRLAFPLTIRKWQKGDHFKPLGMKGWKKLSDFFTDSKLTLYQKQDVWVLQSGNDIVWVMGYRMDDRFKITPATQQIIRLEFTPLPQE